MKTAEALDFSAQLEQSRLELVQLSERVKRLVQKRSERETLVQRFHRSTISALAEARSFNVCSLCANDHATAQIEHVRAAMPGTKCDHCGQPAVMWFKLVT